MPELYTALPTQNCFYCGLYDWVELDDDTYVCDYCQQYARIGDSIQRVGDTG